MQKTKAIFSKLRNQTTKWTKINNTGYYMAKLLVKDTLNTQFFDPSVLPLRSVRLTTHALTPQLKTDALQQLLNNIDAIFAICTHQIFLLWTLGCSWYNNRPWRVFNSRQGHISKAIITESNVSKVGVFCTLLCLRNVKLMMSISCCWYHFRKIRIWIF